jgi:predicted anti-sigma-YlaC factor YlaD
MRDPWYRLKLLPWRSLFQAAIITILIGLVLEFLTILATDKLLGVSVLVGWLFSPGIASLTLLAASIGIGALAVYILEQTNCPSINTGTLWGLVLCLSVFLLLLHILPLSSLLQLSYVTLVGVVLGVFWKGRPYWRSYRRR